MRFYNGGKRDTIDRQRSRIKRRLCWYNEGIVSQQNSNQVAQLAMRLSLVIVNNNQQKAEPGTLFFVQIATRKRE